MSDEDSERGEIKTICRSIGLEVLIVELLAHHYLRAPDPIATAAAHREHMRNTWSQIAAPFLHDPAASELIVREIGDAIPTPRASDQSRASPQKAIHSCGEPIGSVYAGRSAAISLARRSLTGSAKVNATASHSSGDRTPRPRMRSLLSSTSRWFIS
jgi:hypothetical protein